MMMQFASMQAVVFSLGEEEKRLNDSLSIFDFPFRPFIRTFLTLSFCLFLSSLTLSFSPFTHLSLLYFALLTDGELLSVPLEDEGYFTGQGDYQFDIYRKMRDETAGNWSSHFPRTNIFWLHYLVDKLIHEVTYADTKKQRSPPQSAAAGGRRTPLGEVQATNGRVMDDKKAQQAARRREKKALMELKERVLAYGSVDEMTRDPIFADLIQDESVVSMLALMHL